MKNTFRKLSQQELEMVSGGDIVVTGNRPGGGWPWWDWGSGYGGDDGDYDGGGGGGSDTPPEPPHPTPCEQEAQADEQAQQAADQINAAFGITPGTFSLNNTLADQEYGAILYEDANGNIQTFGPEPLTPVGVTGSLFSTEALYSAFENAGLDRGSITGFVHNHPGGVFTDVDLNRYPSGADWAAAAGAVELGADPATYSLYVVDGNGNLREFAYADRALYENLTDEQKRNGENLPEGTESGSCDDGSSQTSSGGTSGGTSGGSTSGGTTSGGTSGGSTSGGSTGGGSYGGGGFGDPNVNLF